ncbi:MAG: 30S ribosomal protein S20 [Clostridia bacterium]|nr:30S ribosomal protein S20 [Clostridia bacterium]
MANIKSAKKRVLVIEKKTLQNKMAKSALKTAIKKFFSAVDAGDKAAATEAYTVAVRKVDQAVAHGLLAKNNGARKKSRYTRMLNAM